MHRSLVVCIFCFTLMAGWQLSFAAETTGSADSTEIKRVLATGDAEAGKAASVTCGACHGANGVAAIKTNPNLAGQGAPYLLKQLMEFKSGARQNAIMQGMVAALDEKAMADLAAYFASQPAAEGVSEADNLELGRNIYQGGISSVGIPACMSCHGPAGAGNDAAKFPRVNGQNAEYTVATLQNFRSGVRANDPNKMMQLVAHRLSDTEIAALANYLQGLH